MKIGKSPVVVVAHPDDEVLFAGGLLIRFWAKQWTVICCSVPRRDGIRAWKFFESCRRLNVRGQLLPVVESEPSEPLNNLDSLGMLEQFDTLVTHNEWGDYGHLHHAQVNNYVTSIAGTRPVITFGYRRDGIGSEEIVLNDIELEKKKFAMRAYDHVLPYNGHDWPKWRALEHRYYQEEGLSPEVETFDVCANQSQRDPIAA